MKKPVCMILDKPGRAQRNFQPIPDDRNGLFHPLAKPLPKPLPKPKPKPLPKPFFLLPLTTNPYLNSTTTFLLISPFNIL